MESTAGAVIVFRADGSSGPLRLGDTVSQGDSIETAPHGAVGVVFSNGTGIALGGGSRLGIVATHNAAFPESLIVAARRGTFVVVGGAVRADQPRDLTVATPLGESSLQDTQIGLAIHDNGVRTVLMEDIDGVVGEAVIESPAGTAVLNRSRGVMIQSVSDSTPRFEGVLNAEDLMALFRVPLLHLPVDRTAGNDYGARLINDNDHQDLGSIETASAIDAPMWVTGGDSSFVESRANPIITLDGIPDSRVRLSDVGCYPVTDDGDSAEEVVLKEAS